MDGTLKDIDSRGWRTRLIGAFIAQQVIFALICIVFSGDAVRPPFMYRPNGMTEADRELYYAYHDVGAAVGINIDLIVDCVLFFPMLVFAGFFFCYLFSWRKLQRRERVVFIAVEVVRIVAVIAVKEYFQNYTGVFRMYMVALPNEITSVDRILLYLIHRKFRRKEPELDAPITEAGE